MEGEEHLCRLLRMVFGSKSVESVDDRETSKVLFDPLHWIRLGFLVMCCRHRMMRFFRNIVQRSPAR